MLVSANRIKTFLELLSIVDFLSILPFIVEMCLMLAGINTEKLRNFKVAFAGFLPSLITFLGCIVGYENFKGSTGGSNPQIRSVQFWSTIVW